MSESLRNDGRVWVPKQAGDQRPPHAIPEADRDYYLERKYPAFGNLVPRDVASRNAKRVCDEGQGIGPGGLGVYLDFTDAIARDGLSVIQEKYGNLFDMYHEITNEDAYKTPMRIFPAIHYTMGGLWVDYDLMSNVPGLFVLGEANFSDHGANRLGASALMQGLADGYFVIPYTIGKYLSGAKLDKIDPAHAACRDAEREATERLEKLLSIRGKRTVDSIHKELGLMLWNKCGMSRDEAGLNELLEQIPSLREEFWRDVTVTGSAGSFNQVIERAGRVADFLEFAETMVLDALERRESCGGHFREESQTAEGEALRDDDNFCHVSAWEWRGENTPPVMHKEPLSFEAVHPTQRSYK
jgi:succinate dehydrogenase / fumarate reductase flavoprotein subunit